MVLATLFYWLLYFLRGTKSANILIGIVCLFCLIGILADWLQLQVLRYLLTRIWTILGVASVVIFQPELRRGLEKIGRNKIFDTRQYVSYENMMVYEKAINELVNAVQNLSKTKTGEYTTAYRIPTSGTGTLKYNNLANDMFTDTGGTFTGTPNINTTYYTSNKVV
jgi:diadenylate cyclase